MVDKRSAAVKFGISGTQVRLLFLLLERTYVSSSDISNALKMKTPARMMVKMLREQMMRHGITIHSRRDIGYWLDDEDKRMVKAELGMVRPKGGEEGEGEGEGSGEGSGEEPNVERGEDVP